MSIKKGPNFTISLIPAFGGHPLQIFGPSITEARGNLPNVLAKMLCYCTPGHPPVTPLVVIVISYRT